MSSKDWKSLLFVAAVSLLATACGPDDKKEEPGSSYAGLWASKANLTTYRDSKNDINRFCAQAVRIFDRNGRASMPLYPYVIHANGEVFTYDSDYDIQTKEYRDRNYQGVVSDVGTFAAVPVNYQNYGHTRQSIIKDRSVFMVNENRTLLTVFDRRESRNYYFIRTSPEEMNNYLASLQVCKDAWNRSKGKPQDEGAGQGSADQRTEEGRAQHEDDFGLDLK